MPRTVRFSVLALIPLVVGVALLTVAVSGQSGYMPSTKNGDWTHYTADVRGSKYMPLDQINASNFNQLEVAWRFKTDNLGTRPEFKLEGTPLVIKGIMYTTGGTRRAVFSLRADTGEMLWTHSEFEGQRAVNAPRQLSGRGLSYWTDGKGDERVIYVTPGYRLVALDAKTGTRIKSFGQDGIIDMKVGVYYGNGRQIDLETGDIGLHSTPTVVKDVVIVGSAMKEGMTVKTHNNAKGVVRAYDVRTGKELWRFDTIPKPGEFGYNTWENESALENGNTGVWTQITVDEDLGIVYLPVETPTSDFYGGHRSGDNLFSESLVAADLKTGQRKWHFQFVHHPIWDHDMSSAPILADITVDGKPIKAVAVPSKQAWLYVFDRVTGKPVWPIVETPVPASDVPGEKAAKTQPFPPKSLAYARTHITEDDLIDFTPALRQEALTLLRTKYRWEAVPYVPYIVGSVDGKLGTINIGNTSGGTNWPGAGYDPENQVFYSQAGNSSVTQGSLRKPPPGFSDITYVAGREGTPFREMEGPGFGSAADAPPRREGPPAAPPAAAPGAPAPAAGGRGGGGGFGLNIQGLSIVKPPYGVLSAIDLKKGALMWSVPHGDTPDQVRNNPALKGMNIPKTGQGGSVGLFVTRTLVVVGDPQVTAPPGRPRGAMLRAYDKKTGQQVGEVWMPAPQSGSPMTYMVNGKQYIVVAVSGGNHSGEYISFKLPDHPTTTTAGQPQR